MKVALLGCGRIANKRHAPLLSSGLVEGAELVAVCDIVREKAQATGDQYEVPWYTDGDEMMRDANPDILTICTPSGMHFAHAMHFLNYGKPVIVEKPLALVYADAVSLVYNAQRLRVPLFTVLQNRFNVAVRHLHKAWNAGRFGNLINATVCVRWSRDEDYYSDWHGTWAQAGGVLANQAIHHIDLLTWLFGMPERCFAYATSTRSGEVEDTLVGVIDYGNGATASLELTAAAHVDLEGSLTVNGTKGMAKIGGFAVNRVDVWEIDEKEPQDDAIRGAAENPPDVYGYGHGQFYAHVLRSLRYGAPSFIDGRDSLRLVTALYQSVEGRCEVEVEDELHPPYSVRLGVQ